MKLILGIDTSNYTTSAALINAESGELVSFVKKLLPVKEGQRGLRQSDAVFHHTAALPDLLGELYKDIEGETVAVSVSDRPCSEEGSYMPCFLAGLNAASAVSAALGVPLFKTTHQKGHILACLYGCQKLDFLNRDFVCFHISGGTTDALLVKPDKEEIISVKRVAKSLDLKAGQAVDRIGVKMGLSFPAGAQLDLLAAKSKKQFNKKATFKGADCSLSGLENMALTMLKNGESQEDTARFTVDYIANTLKEMSEKILGDFPHLPLFFAGGVMSNSIIKSRLSEELGAYFCPARYSADNAAGTAVYGYLKWNSLKN